MMLNKIIRICPTGLPFAQKISEVTPIRDASSVVGLLRSNSKKDSTVSSTEQPHSASSYFENNEEFFSC